MKTHTKDIHVGDLMLMFTNTVIFITHVDMFENKAHNICQRSAKTHSTNDNTYGFIERNARLIQRAE